MGVVLVLALLLAGALPGRASAIGATRTWVSGVGDDANPCSRTAPCKTFAGAISKTETGGEIDTLDPGGYGAVTITKAITIDATFGSGSILVSGTNAIVIQAGPTEDVVLRGISFDGVGSSTEACPNTGLDAIRIQRAHTVNIEDVAINHFQSNGIDIIPGESNINVLIDGSDIRNTCGAGVNVAPTNGHTANVTVRNSTITNAGIGVLAGQGATAWLTGDTITGNTTGIQTANGGIINSFGDNQIYGNVTNGTATNNVDQYGMPITSPPAPGPLPPAGPPQTTTAAGTPGAPSSSMSCVVPKLAGLKLTTARARLSVAHCKLGKISYRKTKQRKKVGVVTGQGKKAGTKLAAGATVNVTVGKR